MDNEKRRLVAKHIRKLLSVMTDDQLRCLVRHIEEGNHWQSDPNSIGADIVWNMIISAEEWARSEMINKLTKQMTELSEVKNNVQRVGKSDGDEGLFSIRPGNSLAALR